MWLNCPLSGIEVRPSPVVGVLHTPSEALHFLLKLAVMQGGE